jgi:glycerol uptake facilitator protein
MKCRRESIGEVLGTFMLVLFGCGSVAVSVLFGAHHGLMQVALAWGIGVTVTSVICLIAPLTQAGLNPARDLGPRLVAWLAGWGGAAFPDRVGGFFHVYVLAPLLGGACASLLFVRVLEPLMTAPSDGCDCKPDQP